MGVVRFDLGVAGFPAFACAGFVVEPVDPVHALGELQTLAAAGGAPTAEAEMGNPVRHESCGAIRVSQAKSPGRKPGDTGKLGETVHHVERDIAERGVPRLPPGASCSNAVPNGIAGMALRPEGLAAEVTNRPGREVWAWIARESAEESRPVGFVALVRAGTLAVPRWSIGWLVVDPVARRRGIGTALVATAVRFAGARGASVVHAETLDRWPAAVAFWAAARLAALSHVATLESSGESRKTAEG